TSDDCSGNGARADGIALSDPGRRPRRVCTFGRGVVSVPTTQLALVMVEAIAQFYRPVLERALAQLAVDVAVSAEAERAAMFAVAIAPEHGRLASMTTLKCVIAPGAGVDHILADPLYPSHVSLVRLMQPDLLQRMKEYVFLHVLSHHR